MSEPARRLRLAVLSALAGSGLAGILPGLAQADSLVLPAAPAVPVTGSTGPTGPSGLLPAVAGDSGPVATGQTKQTPHPHSSPTTTPAGPTTTSAPSISSQGGQSTTTSAPKRPATPAHPHRAATPHPPAHHTAVPHATAPAPSALAGPIGPNEVALPPSVLNQQFGVLPPAVDGGVSAAALNFFRVRPFLLALYQAAAIEYDVPWQVLAGINEVETNYGNDLAVSSAGAVGWMQFLPSSWLAYGVDATAAGQADPYNAADAIFAAARYLHATGGSKDIRRAVFAYNHSDAYVNSVMLRAQLVATFPESLIDSLSGLAQGRLPADGASWAPAPTPAPPAPSTATGGATQVAPPVLPAPGGHAPIRFVDLHTPANAVVRAAQDGSVMKFGYSRKLGRYLILRDIFGAVYYYADLGRLATRYPAVKVSPRPRVRLPVTPVGPTHGAPALPASAGVQPPVTLHVAAVAQTPLDALAGGGPLGKIRLFARPSAARPPAVRRDTSSTSAHDQSFSTLRAGSLVNAGTPLGTVSNTPDGQQGHIRFAIQPATDSRTVNPLPILQDWKLLDETLHPKGARPGSSLIAATAGYVFLLSKAQLQRAVLGDPGISIYACGRQDIAAGEVDPRVLAVMAFLSREGLQETVSSLRCGPYDRRSASWVKAAHRLGEAVTISAVNGVALAGHQGPASVADATERALFTLQGRFTPAAIVSLMAYPGMAQTVASRAAADHLDIVFRPETHLASVAAKDRGSAPPLSADDWDRLIAVVASLPVPSVSTTPSAAAVPDPRSGPNTNTLGAVGVTLQTGH